MKHRGVLVGCGFFAQNHLNGWKGLEGVELVAVCDLDAEKAARAAAQLGTARVYTDAAAMLEAESPDFVDIVTTVESHRPLVELACRSGARVVVCQKPFAQTQADGEAMVAAAEATGAKLIVHENFRWQKGLIELKRRLDDGQVGTPHFARFSFRTHYDIYSKQPYLTQIERFLIFDVGLHLFDLARHFMGEVAHVACQTQSLNPLVRGEDVFTSLLRHESGAVSVVDASYYTWHSPEPFPQVLARIEGDAASIELLEGYRLRLHTPGDLAEFDVEPEVPRWGERPWHTVQDSVMRFQSHVWEVLEGTAEPEPSGADNLKTLALALAAYAAAERTDP
jgi:D-apiose dehydrogenase